MNGVSFFDCNACIGLPLHRQIRPIWSTDELAACMRKEGVAPYISRIGSTIVPSVFWYEAASRVDAAKAASRNSVTRRISGLQRKGTSCGIPLASMTRPEGGGKVLPALHLTRTALEAVWLPGPRGPAAGWWVLGHGLPLNRWL